MVTADKHKQKSQVGQIFSMTLATGAIVIVEVGMAVSLAALIFAGPLEAALPTAAGAFILGGAITSILVGWRSSILGVASGAQDTAAVVLATVVGPATLGLSGTAQTATALVMVGVSTLIIGVTLLLLGKWRLGSMVRYIPQPVVGGFLAGTGWLMLRGGFEVMINQTIHVSSFLDIFQWEQAQFLLPGLALALFIVVAVARRWPPLSISSGIIAASLFFYAGVLATSSVTAVQDGGWLIGPFGTSARWSPFTLGDLRATDWGTIAAQTPAFGAVALIGVVGLLLNLSALEALGNDDVDFDHELRIAGGANLLAGGLGGVGGWHLIGDTVLARQLGVRNRVVPIGVGVLGIVIMLVGSQMVEMVPRAVAGGILAGMGLALLWGWVMDYVIPATLTNKLLGIGILTAIAAVGPLMGVGLGVVVAAGLFVVQYSRIEPVRHELSGRSIRSTVDRSASVQAALDTHIDATEIIILDGYLFFGSVTRAVQMIRDKTSDTKPVPLQALIIDFRRVTGMDVSAATSLAQNINRLAAGDISVILCDASPTMYEALTSSGLDTRVQWADVLDDAVERNEEAILAQLDLPSAPNFATELDTQLDGQAQLLLDVCRRVELEPGEQLMTQGEPSESLFLIETGELAVVSHSVSGVRQRLRKTGPGSVLGEVAFSTGSKRTADVMAETSVVAHELSRAAWQELRTTHPVLATDFQSFLTRTLADRVRTTTQAMNQLLR